MPLSLCFRVAKEYESHSLWQELLPYLGAYILAAIISSLILRQSGSMRPRRMFVWLATWHCSDRAFRSCRMELGALVLLFLSYLPCLLVVTWTVRTYQFEYTYDGTEETDLHGTYQNCKTMSGAIFLLGASIESVRVGLLTWSFRNFILFRFSYTLIVLAAFALIAYSLMLTVCVEENDDIMAAVVFLSFSAAPLLRVIFTHCDDLALGLTDYLYRVADNDVVLAKGAKYSSFEKRWGILSYVAHVGVAFLVLIAYSISGLWLHTRQWSSLYVVFWVLITDLMVLTALPKLQLQHFSEMALCFSTVVGIRAIVVYLGWQSREDGNEGAWEFVEPVWFLLMTLFVSKQVAASFWSLPCKTMQHAVNVDRHREWMICQRSKVLTTICISSKDDSTVSKWFRSRIKRMIRSLLLDGGRTPSAQEQIRTSITRAQWFVRKNEVLEIDYEKEISYKKCLVTKEEDGKTARTRLSTGNPMKVMESLDQVDCHDSGARLARLRDSNKMELSRLGSLRRRQALREYSTILVFFAIHVVYNIFIDRVMDGDREVRTIWPFSHQGSAYRFAWAALVWAGEMVIWTCVYGAATTACFLGEDMDEIKEEIRLSIKEESEAECVLPPAFKASRIRPRPLSFQHAEAMSVVDSKEKIVDVAVRKAMKNEHAFLESERPKIASEVAVLVTMQHWDLLLQEHKKSKVPLSVDIIVKHVVRILRSDGVAESVRENYTRIKNNNQDGSLAQKSDSEAATEMIQLLCQWGLEHAAIIATKYANAHGGTHNQQVAAAISGATYAHAFYTSWNTAQNLKPLALCRQHAAKKAANRLGMRLSTAQLANTALGESAFLGHERMQEIHAVVDSPIRWPNYKGFLGMRRDVLQHRERQQEGITYATIGCFLGIVLSFFLLVVVVEGGDSNAWLGFTTKGNKVNFVLSLFLPPVLICSLIVIQSWERNKYYFFTNTEAANANDLHQLWTDYMTGVMRVRDQNNMRCLLCAAVSLFTWWLFALFWIDGVEGCMMAATVICVVSTVVPIWSAQRHKDASFFVDNLFMRGMILGAVLVGVLCLIADALWPLAAFFLYYTLVFLTLFVLRSSLDGWQASIFFAHADKAVLLGVGAFVYAAYTHYRSDYDKGTLIAAISGGMVVLGLSGLFLYLCRKLAHMDVRVNSRELESVGINKRIKYLDLDDHKTAGKDSTTDSQVSTELARSKSTLQFSSGYEPDEQDVLLGADVLDEEETLYRECCAFLAANWPIITIVSIALLLLSGSIVFAAVVTSAGSYSNADKFFVYVSAILGTLALLAFGVGAITNLDSWVFTSVLVLPVVIPAHNMVSNGFDFDQGMLTGNMPFLMMIVSFIMLLLWGMLATVMPSADGYLGGDQMAIGVTTINVVVLSSLFFPYLKILFLNSRLEKYYEYLVTKPCTQSPCSHIERVCIQHFEDWAASRGIDLSQMNSREDIELTADEVYSLCCNSWPESMGQAIAENTWPAPAKHRADNKSSDESGLFDKQRFHKALKAHCKYKSKEEQPDAYTFFEFVTFFKRYMMGYGTMQFDHSFLSEKREQATRELQTFRMQVSRPKTGDLEEHVFTASQMECRLVDTLYPQALPLLKLFGCLYASSADESVEDRSARISDNEFRKMFMKICREEEFIVTLHEEKLLFEGHFTLAVAHSAFTAMQVDTLAAYALQGGFGLTSKDPETDGSSNDPNFIHSTAHGADESASNELPLEMFTEPLATTLIESICAEYVSTQEAIAMFKLPRKHEEATDRSGLTGYDSRENQAMNHMIAGNTQGIGNMYSALKLLCSYLAVPCAPHSIAPQKRRSIQLLSADHWMRIFGNVGDAGPHGEPSENTVLDLFSQVEQLWTAWQKFVERYHTIQAPLVYGAALLLQFYKTELFVNWFATGNTRLRFFNEVREVSIGFRVFVDNVIKAAKADITVSSFATNPPSKAFNQLFQEVNACVEGFEEACRAIFPSKDRPHLGPAVLREAHLLLQAQAVYEVVFAMLGAGANEVKIDEVNNWLKRLRDREREDEGNSAHWDSRLRPKCFRGDVVSKEDFVTSHIKLVMFPTATKLLGQLCVTGNKSWHKFEVMLESVKEDCIEELAAMKAPSVTEPSAAAGEDAEEAAAQRVQETAGLAQRREVARETFAQAVECTGHVELLKWFKLTTQQSEDSFSHCFHYKNPSYLWHFQRAQSAISDKISEEQYSRAAIELKQLFVDKSLNNVMIEQAKEMKLLYEGHKHLQALVELFDADPQTRRGYAAMYQVLRVLDMSKTDGDIRYAQEESARRAKGLIETHLGGVLGNCSAEELEISKATNILYMALSSQPNSTEAGIVTGLPVRLVSPSAQMLLTSPRTAAESPMTAAEVSQTDNRSAEQAPVSSDVWLKLGAGSRPHVHDNVSDTVFSSVGVQSRDDVAVEGTEAEDSICINLDLDGAISDNQVEIKVHVEGESAGETLELNSIKMDLDDHASTLHGSGAGAGSSSTDKLSGKPNSTCFAHPEMQGFEQLRLDLALDDTSDTASAAHLLPVGSGSGVQRVSGSGMGTVPAADELVMDSEDAFEDIDFFLLDTMLVATSMETLDFNVENLKIAVASPRGADSGSDPIEDTQPELQLTESESTIDTAGATGRASKSSSGDGTLAMKVIRAAILTPFEQVTQVLHPASPIVQVKGYRLRNGEKTLTSYHFVTESLEQHRILYDLLRKHGVAKN